MEKFLKWTSVTLAGLLLGVGIISTLVVPVMAADEGVELHNQDSHEPVKEQKIDPTFRTEFDQRTETAQLWMGKNALVFGNNVATSLKVNNGLMLIAGNNLTLQSTSEYGFVAGNIVNFTGTTDRDLFVAGNIITLGQGANIGRNTFATGSVLNVETNLMGSLAFAGDTLELKDDVVIAGNLDLSVENIIFGKNIKIAGTLTYNENAEITGLENVNYGSIEAYAVPELDARAVVLAEIYAKFVSIAGLFIVFSLICALYPKIHDKITTEATANRVGIDLALGFGTLVIIPIVALFTFITFVAAPLGLIALALYVIMIYLAQGFTGAWLGHLIIRKLFKKEGSNVFVEALLGIFILGLLSEIPYIGFITGFLSLLFGLGLILNCIKPAQTKEIAKTAKSTK